MRPKGKKLCCQTLPPDVLSDLPENLIDAILMCLPFRDAVRTGILSKKWRYNWCRLPEFTLDRTVWETRKGLICRTSKFTKIISHILIRHAGPIRKFTLSAPDSRECPEIDDLIYFLSRNGIEHLVLRHSYRGFPYILPSSFFTCTQLRHLTLQYCLIKIQPPPDFYGFERLIRLELYDVEISSKLLGSLISHCSLLEHLVLYDIFSLSKVIEINAPMLRSFDFRGSIRSICLKNIPLLAKFSLAGDPDYQGAKGDIVKFFESFSALEHLLLNNMRFAAEVYEVPRKLSFNLNNVKHLYISNIDMFESKEFSWALCLIRSFPYLQYMKIQGCYSYEDEDKIPAFECLEVEHCSDVTLDHLREVELELANGGRVQEMQLVKLLLAKSPVLMRMLLVLCGDEEPATVKILSKLKEFHRASPEAEVVIG